MALKSSRRLTPYPYTDLPTPTSIRILKVLPEDQNQGRRIAVSLEVVDLKDSPRYTAISYTWGNPFNVYAEEDEDKIQSFDVSSQTNKTIICNTHYIKVTQNCCEFLKVVQQIGAFVAGPQYARWASGKRIADTLIPDDTQYYWIDAICINQSSMPEKSAQVSIMRDIYDKAGLVLVWLGPKDVFSDEAIDTLLNIANVSPSKIESADALALGTTFENVIFYDALGIAPIHGRQWQSVYAFLERSWFIRGWIIQEISLARRAMVLCGARCFPFRFLTTASVTCFTLGITGALAGMNRGGYSRSKAGAFAEADEFDKFLLSNSHILSGTVKSLGNQTTGSLNGRKGMINMNGRRKLVLTMPPRSTGGQLDFLVGLQWSLSDPKHLHFEDFRRRVEGISMPLQFLLYLCDGALVSQSDDKVYAFIGLATESCWKSFPINYARPVEETYTMVTRQMMRTSKGVRALSLCPDQCRRKLTALPSWVPDFSVERERHTLDTGFDGRMGTYFPLSFDASRGLEWYDDDSDLSFPLIPVEGIHYAMVCAQANIKPVLRGTRKLEQCFDWLEFGKTAGCTIEDLVKTVSGFDAVRLTKDVDYPSLETIIEYFKMRTEHVIFLYHIDMVTAGKNLLDGLEKFNHADEKFRKKFALYSESTEPICLGPKMIEIHDRTRDRILASVESDREGIQSQRIQPNNLWTPEDWKTLSSIFEKQLGAYTSQQFQASGRLLNAGHRDSTLFQTEEIGKGGGNVGRGPISVSKGDELWVLAGGKVPYLLRPIGNDNYEFIGEAYLDGIMYGEVVESASKRLRRITLK